MFFSKKNNFHNFLTYLHSFKVKRNRVVYSKKSSFNPCVLYAIPFLLLLGETIPLFYGLSFPFIYIKHIYRYFCFFLFLCGWYHIMQTFFHLVFFKNEYYVLQITPSEYRNISSLFQALQYSTSFCKIQPSIDGPFWIVSNLFHIVNNAARNSLVCVSFILKPDF